MDTLPKSGTPPTVATLGPKPKGSFSSCTLCAMESLPCSTSFALGFYEHLKARCRGVLDVSLTQFPSTPEYSKATSNRLPEVDLHRVQRCRKPYAVLSHNSTTNISRVIIDSDHYSVLKQQTIQTLYAECFKPHRVQEPSAQGASAEQERLVRY